MLEHVHKGERKKQQTRPWYAYLWLLPVLFVVGVLFTGMLFTEDTANTASPPAIITYQGKLLESGASATTTQSMQFLIYDADSGGSLLYTAGGTIGAPTAISVTPSSGIFAVNLGDTGTNSIDPTIFKNNASLYLEIVIGATTLSPRKRLTSVPFSVNSQYLDGVAATSTASSSTYIPISASDGSFTFNTTTINNDFTVDSGVLYVDSTNNRVGINSSTPNYDLSVNGQLYVSATSTLSTTTINGTVDIDSGVLYVDTANNRIGINSSTPGYDLSVNGSTYISNNITGNGNLTINGTTGLATTTIGGDLDVSSGVLYVDVSNTRVGINSSTPGYDLSVNGNAFFTNTTTISSALIVGVNNASSEVVTDTSFVYAGADDAYIHDLLGVGDALFVENYIHLGDELTMWADGSILGNPGPTLQSSANLGFLTTNSIILGASTTTLSGFFNVDSGTFVVDDDTNRIGINSSTPNYSLTVTGDAYISATTTLATTTINGDLNVDSGVLYVDATNNRVGVNSSTPNYDLSVNGTSYFSGTSTYANFINAYGRVKQPTHKSSTSTTSGFNPYKVYVQGDYAYVTGYESAGGLEIFDISNISNPKSVGFVTSTLLNVPDGLDVTGNYAYVVTSDGSVVVIDVFDPNNPTIVGETNELNLDAQDVNVVGPYAYVIQSSLTFSYFRTYNILDPTNPVRINSEFVTSPGLNGQMNMDTQGGFSYIIESNSGNTDGSFEVVDIRDKEDPNSIATLSDGGGAAPYLRGAHDVVVDGNYAYIISPGDDALEVLDISDPYSPTHHGSLVDATNFNGGAMNLFIAEDYLYVAGGSGDRIIIVDISDPANPTVAGTLADGEGGAALDGARSIFVKGNYTFVTADGADDALEIIDISGANIANAEIGNTTISNLQVNNKTFFDKNVHIRGGLNVGNSGLQVNGSIGLSAPSSTITATNTIAFSHKGVFQSYVTTTQDNVFIMETANTFVASSTKYILSVRNNGTNLFSISSNGQARVAGQLFASSTTIGSPGSPGDLAERVDIDPLETVEKGDVLCVDPHAADRYRKCRSKHDQSVSGVVSTQATIITGFGKTDHTAVMALVGRVPIKVNQENGPISRGDLLVASSEPGVAMKYDATQDNGQNTVSIIGVALDEHTELENGSIMSLVRTGWVNNSQYSIAQMSQDLHALAEETGVDIETSPEQMSVIETTGGTIAQINEDLNLNGNYIVNVAGIRAQNNTWSIDENGRFVTNVQTDQGQETLYAVQSQQTEFVFSGSGELEDGLAAVEFDEQTQSLIDNTKPIKVSITLTAEANGVYVTEKDETGFAVQELQSGTSNATFDWVVIASRIISGTSQQKTNEEPEAEDNQENQQDNEEQTENSNSGRSSNNAEEGNSNQQEQNQEEQNGEQSENNQEEIPPAEGEQNQENEQENGGDGEDNPPINQPEENDNNPEENLSEEQEIAPPEEPESREEESQPPEPPAPEEPQAESSPNEEPAPSSPSEPEPADIPAEE